MEERWLPIEGYGGRYIISNFGRIVSSYPVRRAKSSELGFWRQKEGKHQPTGSYLQVCLYKDGKRKKIFVHILVAKHFVPNPFNLPEVNHKDLDKLNNRYSNLEWTTRRGNAIHARNAGVYNAKTNPKRVKKLTEDKVELLKQGIELGRNKKELAKEFGVHYSYVCMVGRGERRV